MKKTECTLKVCNDCAATCCRDLAIEIQRPRGKHEIEELKWQVQFDTVSIFIANRTWHLLVKGNCMHLDKKNRCRIYDTRPEKCREHNPPDCEYHGVFYDTLISNPLELEEYLKPKKTRKKRLIK